ncbi:MAG: HDIG domain-containing protein [Candidatus Methanomethylophilus sp.]|nr:HDIG domain-containing protein [Methanomethylophilus sp.]
MSTRMTDIPTDKQCIDLLWEAGCKKRVVVHCATVRAVAEVIAAGIPQADMDVVIAGALLHDIGRSVDHSIMHAYLGA